MYNVVQRDDVGVTEIAQERRFPDGRKRGTFLFLEANLFEGHHLLSQIAESAVDGGVGAFTQLL